MFSFVLTHSTHVLRNGTLWKSLRTTWSFYSATSSLVCLAVTHTVPSPFQLGFWLAILTWFLSLVLVMGICEPFLLQVMVACWYTVSQAGTERLSLFLCWEHPYGLWVVSKWVWCRCIHGRLGLYIVLSGITLYYLYVCLFLGACGQLQDGKVHESLSAPELLYFTLAYDWLIYGWVSVLSKLIPGFCSSC